MRSSAAAGSLNFISKKNVDDHRKSDAVGIVAEDADHAGLMISVLGKPLDEDFLSYPNSARKAVHVFVELH